MVLPLTLTDGDGFIWDIQTDGRVNNGTIDAFDGGFDNIRYSTFNSISTSSLGGRLINLSATQATNDSDILISRSVYVDPSNGFARWIDTFTNTSNVAVTYTFEMDTELGSGTLTQIVQDGSGDGIFDVTDQFVITDDGDGSTPGGDPVVLHWFNDGTLAMDSVAGLTGTGSFTDDDVVTGYTFTLQPGETFSFATFGAQGDTAADVQDVFSLPTSTLFAGASITELSALQNFDVTDFAAQVTNALTRTGTSQDDILLGSSFDEVFDGADGNDTLVLGNGNDGADGGLGNDVLSLGNGNDIATGGADDDIIDGGAGNDQLNGDADPLQGSVTVSDVVTIPTTQQDLGLNVTLPGGTLGDQIDITGFIDRGTGNSGDFNIVYIIDKSGSMSGTFSGTETVGDLNGDGFANQLIDGTIASFEAVNASLLAAGLQSSNLTVIAFDSSATVVYDGAVGGLGTTLTSLDSGGGTNFEAPLQLAISALQADGPGQNQVFFLSDGFGSGSFSDEVTTLLDPSGLNAEIRALGLGNGASLSQLDLIDDGIANNSAELVLTPSDLTAGLTGSPVQTDEVAELQLFVNGVLTTTIPPTDFVSTPFGLQYNLTATGLDLDAEDLIEVRLVASDPDMTTASVSFSVPQEQEITGDDVIFGGAGDDLIDGNRGDDELFGDDGQDTVVGSAGNDRLFGGNGNDGLFGGTGNDILAGGADADLLDGGSGTDTALYDDSETGVSVNLLLNTGVGGTAQGDTFASIENVLGSFFDDTIIGGDTDNLLEGGAGDDTLEGEGGNDTLNGGIGNDTLRGGFGVDILNGNSGDDVLFGGGDSDQLFGGDGNDRLNGSAGSDTLEGGKGDDTLNGGSGADTVVGGSGEDTVNGGDGADTLRGGGNDDSVFGEAGDDLILGGSGADLLDGGADNDTIEGGTGGDTILGGIGMDTIDGQEDDDDIDGGNDNDTIRGSQGNDTLEGGSGNDTVLGGQDNDSLRGSGGNDILNGGAGSDVLLGGQGNDTLEGGNGADNLNGGSGQDILSGGAGDDTMTGGSGTDTFVLNAAQNGSNTITDFTTGETVDLIGFGFADRAAAEAAFSQDGSNVVFSSSGVTVTFEGQVVADVTAGILLDGVVPANADAPVFLNSGADGFDFSGLVGTSAVPLDTQLDDMLLGGVTNFRADLLIQDTGYGRDLWGEPDFTEFASISPEEDGLLF